MSSHHNSNKKVGNLIEDLNQDKGKEEEEEEEEEDFFNVTIQRSGCAKEHYALQDCFAASGDWRKCHREMGQFKQCMDRQRGK